jgi:hypothetical protein
VGRAVFYMHAKPNLVTHLMIPWHIAEKSRKDKKHCGVIRRHGLAIAGGSVQPRQPFHGRTYMMLIIYEDFVTAKPQNEREKSCNCLLGSFVL